MTGIPILSMAILRDHNIFKIDRSLEEDKVKDLALISN